MKRFTHFMALVTSFALITCANAAVGSTRPDDRASRPSAITLVQPTEVVRPDDRASRPSAITAEHVRVIASGGSGEVHAGGFDWLDAGIGAAAALGLCLIVGGAAFVLRRARTLAYP